MKAELESSWAKLMMGQRLDAAAMVRGDLKALVAMYGPAASTIARAMRAFVRKQAAQKKTYFVHLYLGTSTTFKYYKGLKVRSKTHFYGRAAAEANFSGFLSALLWTVSAFPKCAARARRARFPRHAGGSASRCRPTRECCYNVLSVSVSCCAAAQRPRSEF